MRKFFASRKGATAIEYALIAGMISIAILAAVTAVGGEVLSLFERIAASFQRAQ